MRWVRWTMVVLVGGVWAIACGAGSEGESCDLGLANDDCENGLICRPAAEIQADEPTCCPPGGSAKDQKCKPAVPTGYVPDPSIDASYAADGNATGGSGGGTAGSGSGGMGASAGAAAGGTSSGGAGGVAGGAGGAGGAASGAGGVSGGAGGAGGKGKGKP